VESKAMASSETIPSLEKCLTAVLNRSPLLQEQEQVITQAGLKCEIAGRQWLEHIKLGSDVRYGTDDYVYLDPVHLNYNLNSKPYETIRYSVGIGLETTLFDVATRGKRKQVAQTELGIARMRKEQMILDLKNLVITQYYKMLQSQKNLEIMSLQKASSETQTQMAEIQFNRQQLDFIEYSKIVEFHTKTLLDFEKALYEYQTVKSFMKELTGISF